MIDWLRVDELRKEVGEEAFEEVAELFLEEVDEMMERLPEVEGAQVPAAMHFLRGSALNLGFRSFAALCLDAEKAASTGCPVDLSPLVATYRSARDQLRHHIGAADAA